MTSLLSQHWNSQKKQHAYASKKIQYNFIQLKHKEKERNVIMYILICECLGSATIDGLMK